MNEKRDPAFRFVIFSDKRGVFLGAVKGLAYWSLDGNPKQDAPTFHDEAEAEKYWAAAYVVKPATERRCVEVIVDLPDNRVSAQVCRDRALPWNLPAEPSRRSTVAPSGPHRVPGTLNPQDEADKGGE